ncbi:hypothetical protein D3C78_16800 [compost metagenome]
MNKIFLEKYVAIISILWIVFIAVITLIKHKNLLMLSLNEMGDFLAGCFAPLGFFWLVAGYYQQGIGLKQNSEALRLQAEELKQSTVALQQQVKELNATAEGQKQLVEIAAQELNHKRFEAEPNFIFKISNLDEYEEQVPDEFDYDGTPMGYTTENLIRFDLIFENVGPNARQVKLKSQSGNEIFNIYEVKQELKKKNLTIYDEEYINFRNGQKIDKNYEFSYCNIFGDKYLKSIICTIYLVVDEEGEHLIHQLTYKDFETTI